MKKSLLAMVLVIASYSIANASDYYTSLTGAYGTASTKIKANNTSVNIRAKPWGASIALGTYITPETRAEVAIGYDQYLHNKSDFKYTKKTGNIMLNAYYDFKNSSIVTPYIMGGIGAAVSKHVVNIKNIKIDYSPISFIYQLGLGTNFRISDEVDLGVGYRFKGNSDSAKNATLKITSNSHSGVMQLTFKF